MNASTTRISLRSALFEKIQHDWWHRTMDMAVDTNRRNASARLDTSNVDFDAFLEHPLQTPVVRCLRYMHDVEHHTVCYLRDLLVTRAHRDVEITTFLTIWNYQEHYHGEAIGEVLARHGETANGERVGALREKLTWRDQVRPLLMQFSSLMTRHFTAVHMTWGAINEWTTQAAYGRLIQQANHPVLTELLRKIMRQEGSHIDFYMTQARDRLAESGAARRITRSAISSFWQPVGSSISERTEVGFIINYLFGGEEGRAVAERIDRRIDTLPGLEGLGLVHRAVERLAKL